MKEGRGGRKGRIPGKATEGEKRGKMVRKRERGEDEEEKEGVRGR